MTTIRGRIVQAHEVLDDGWLTVEDDHVSGVGTGAPPEGGIGLQGSWVLPGFVDLHVHGGGGRTVTSGDPDAVQQVAELHRRHGTTRMLASLVTAPVEQMLSATSTLAQSLRHGQLATGTVAGLHLEGPFLSPRWCGAQDPRWMIEPDARLMAPFLEAGQGKVRVVTIAPELPGARAMIRQLRSSGVVLAVGHTDALYEQALEAFDAGASLVTHVCNGMRPAHHREPGVIGAALDSAGVVCEMILDGVHLHPATARMLVRAYGPDHVALVTDAIVATGVGDGRYDLGGQAIDVQEGVARLSLTGSLAGSTLTMDAAVRHAVTQVGLSVTDVSRMASLVPARVLGLDDQIGSLEVGKRADVVVLDEMWRVTAVVSGGRVVHGAETSRRLP